MASIRIGAQTRDRVLTTPSPHHRMVPMTGGDPGRSNPPTPVRTLPARPRLSTLPRVNLEAHGNAPAVCKGPPPAVPATAAACAVAIRLRRFTRQAQAIVLVVDLVPALPLPAPSSPGRIIATHPPPHRHQRAPPRVPPPPVLHRPARPRLSPVLSGRPPYLKAILPLRINANRVMTAISRR